MFHLKALVVALGLGLASQAYLSCVACLPSAAAALGLA